MAQDRDELKKLLKEKGVKSLDDFYAFMRELSNEVVETILEGELADHPGYEKHDKKAKTTDNARNGTRNIMENIFLLVTPSLPLPKVSRLDCKTGSRWRPIKKII